MTMQYNLKGSVKFIQTLAGDSNLTVRTEVTCNKPRIQGNVLVMPVPTPHTMEVYEQEIHRLLGQRFKENRFIANVRPEDERLAVAKDLIADYLGDHSRHGAYKGRDQIRGKGYATAIAKTPITGDKMIDGLITALNDGRNCWGGGYNYREGDDFSSSLEKKGFLDKLDDCKDARSLEELLELLKEVEEEQNADDDQGGDSEGGEGGDDSGGDQQGEESPEGSPSDGDDSDSGEGSGDSSSESNGKGSPDGSGDEDRTDEEHEDDIDGTDNSNEKGEQDDSTDSNAEESDGESGSSGEGNSDSEDDADSDGDGSEDDALPSDQTGEDAEEDSNDLGDGSGEEGDSGDQAGESEGDSEDTESDRPESQGDQDSGGEDLEDECPSPQSQEQASESESGTSQDSLAKNDTPSVSDTMDKLKEAGLLPDQDATNMDDRTDQTPYIPQTGTPRIHNMADKRIRGDRMLTFYHGIDKLLKGMTLSKKVKRHLLTIAQTSYTYGLKTGRMNSKAVAQVFSREHPKIFKQRQSSRIENDSAIVILMDCSGSMHGIKYNAAAASAIAISGVLESLQIDHEIIGFTNTMSHVIYYHFRNLGERCINREEFIDRFSGSLVNCNGNEDGTAVIYAVERLMKQKERSKSLIVLSDGLPTGQGRGNRKRFLTDIVSDLEQSKQINIAAIGILTDAVRLFYSNYTVLRRVEELESALIEVVKKFIIR